MPPFQGPQGPTYQSVVVEALNIVDSRPDHCIPGDQQHQWIKDHWIKEHAKSHLSKLRKKGCCCNVCVIVACSIVRCLSFGFHPLHLLIPARKIEFYSSHQSGSPLSWTNSWWICCPRATPISPFWKQMSHVFRFSLCLTVTVFERHRVI